MNGLRYLSVPPGWHAALVLLGAVACALAVAMLASGLLRLLFGARPEAGSALEASRRDRMRRDSATYRLLEPLVNEQVAPGRSNRPPAESLRRDLVAAGRAHWLPEEYLACSRLEAWLAAGAAALLMTVLLGDVLIGPAAALPAWFATMRLARTRLAKRARTRLSAIKSQLPFAIDLMALVIEAGSGFQDALAVAIREGKGQVLAEELGTTLREIQMGRPRRDALEAMKDRLPDPDISDFITAVVRGEELGTPVGQTLKTQAGQLRQKRSLWIEKAAAEAQVMMSFPGMIVMIACLLVVVAPLLVSALAAR